MPYLGLNMTTSTCFQSFLIGIVVPDPETLPDFAAKLGIKGSYEDVCKNPVSVFTFLVTYRQNLILKSNLALL